MIKIIETNLILNPVTNEISDHQSRVVEISNWYDIIQEIKDGKTVIRSSVLGNLHGNTVPRESKIENLVYDDKHLSCDIITFDKCKTKKLIYRI